MAKQPYPSNGNHTPEAVARREAFWRDVVGRWEASGLSKRRFCEHEGLGNSALQWWIRELRRRDRSHRRTRSTRPKRRGSAPVGSFVPVRVTNSVHAASKPVEVIVGGQIIRVLPDFDAETLRRIVQVLEGWPTLAEVGEGRTC